MLKSPAPSPFAPPRLADFQPGTQKVHEASGPSFRERIAIVQPGWLLESSALWERQAEEPFMLELEPSTTPPLPPSRTTTTTKAVNGDGGGSGKEDEGEKVGELEEGLVREIDWGQADRELEEFLDGSESEGGSEFGMGSGGREIEVDEDDEDEGVKTGTETEAGDGPVAAATAIPVEAEPSCVRPSLSLDTTRRLSWLTVPPSAFHHSLRAHPPAPSPEPVATSVSSHSSDPLLLAAVAIRKKRLRTSSLAPSEPDSLFDGSAPPTPLAQTEPSTRCPSPKRSRLANDRSRTPSPTKSAPAALPADGGRSPKRIPRTVSFDDSASVRSGFSSSQAGFDGEEDDGSDDDDDESDGELDDWAKEFAGSMASAGSDG